MCASENKPWCQEEQRLVLMSVKMHRQFCEACTRVAVCMRGRIYSEETYVDLGEISLSFVWAQMISKTAYTNNVLMVQTVSHRMVG